MAIDVFLVEPCVQACNQTEQTEQRVRLGSARWLACSVQLARWPILAAQAQLGSAKQLIGLLGLGLITALSGMTKLLLASSTKTSSLS